MKPSKKESALAIKGKDCTWCGGWIAPTWLTDLLRKSNLRNGNHDCYLPESKKQYLYRSRRFLKAKAEKTPACSGSGRKVKG